MRSNTILLLLFAMFMDTGTATWGPIGMEPYGDPYGVNKYRDPFGMDKYAGVIASSCELAAGRIANKEVWCQLRLFISHNHSRRLAVVSNYSATASKIIA